MAEVLSGEIALVTGANRGIGRQISLELAAAGATVVLSSRKVASLTEVVAQIENAGGHCDCVMRFSALCSARNARNPDVR